MCGLELLRPIADLICVLYMASISVIAFQKMDSLRACKLSRVDLRHSAVSVSSRMLAGDDNGGVRFNRLAPDTDLPVLVNHVFGDVAPQVRVAAC